MVIAAIIRLASKLYVIAIDYLHLIYQVLKYFRFRELCDVIEWMETGDGRR